MASNTGILAFGAYVPRRRLQRSAICRTNGWFAPGIVGKGEKAISNWDEDTLTMAVEAARDCMNGFDRSDIAALRLASTTFPNADRLNAGVVKEAINLTDTIEASDSGGSLRAGASALIQALESDKTTLVVASDKRLARPASAAEIDYGDAAAAMITGAGDVIARLVGSHSVTIDFVDHFRASGEKFDYEWEARWIREEGHLKIAGSALKEAIARAGLLPEDIHHLAIGISARGAAASLAKSAGFPADKLVDDQTATIGNSGAAYPLMLLAAALEKANPGDRILVLGFGQGADILIFQVTDAIRELHPRMGVAGWLAEREEDSNYARFLFHRGLLDLEKGMRAEMEQKQPGSTLYRKRKAVMGLVGGRCTKTGTVQYPKTEIGVNPNDRTRGTQEDYPMADLPVTVASFTADNLTYCPDPPLYYGMVDFEGGGRMTADFADIEPSNLEVGAPMRMVFRIKAQDEVRNFTKYFWKAAPQPTHPNFKKKEAK